MCVTVKLSMYSSFRLLFLTPYFLFLLYPPSLFGLWLLLLLFQYSNVENVTCQRAAFDLWFNCHLPTISKWESLWDNFCVTNSCYNLDIYNCEYDQIGGCKRIGGIDSILKVALIWSHWFFWTIYFWGFRTWSHRFRVLNI